MSPFVLQLLRQWGLTAPQANVPAASFPLVLGVRVPVGSVSQNIPSFTKNQRYLGNVDWNLGVNDHLAGARELQRRARTACAPGVPKAELNANREVSNQLASCQLRPDDQFARCQRAARGLPSPEDHQLGWSIPPPKTCR